MSNGRTIRATARALRQEAGQEASNLRLGIRVWRCAAPDYPLLGDEQQKSATGLGKAAEIAILCAAPSVRRRAEV